MTLGIEGVFLYSLYNFIQTLEEDLTLNLIEGFRSVGQIIVP